jgi:hypothetical protein
MEAQRRLLATERVDWMEVNGDEDLVISGRYAMLVHTCFLFGLGLRLIPVIVKAALAIFGIGGQGVAGAPVVVNLCPSLMAFCPATHALNGVAALACSAVQTVHCTDASSLMGCPARVAVFAISFAGSNGAASLADYFVSQVCGCAVLFLVSCLHSVLLEQVLAVFLPM